MRVRGSSYGVLFSLARAPKAVERGALILALLLLAQGSLAAGNDLEPYSLSSTEAYQLLSDRKWPEAVIAFRSMLKQSPDSTQAILGLARALVFSGRREEALSLLIRAAEDQGRSKRQKFGARANVLSKIFLTNSTFQIYQEGVNLLLSGKYRLARERFDRALEVEADNVELLVRTGQVLVLDGDFDSAAERLRLARRLNPFEPVIRVWLGRAMHKRGEHREAVAELRSAVSELPDSEHAAVWLAEAMISNGQRPGAIRLLEEHVKRWPFHLNALVSLARYRLIFAARDEVGVWAARKDLQVALSRVSSGSVPGGMDGEMTERHFGILRGIWPADLKSEIARLLEQVEARVAAQKQMRADGLKE